MPAITLENRLVLPRVKHPEPARSVERPVARVVPARRATEGAGFEVARRSPDLSR